MNLDNHALEILSMSCCNYKVTFCLEFYLPNNASIAKFSCAGTTCKHVTGPIKPILMTSGSVNILRINTSVITCWKVPTVKFTCANAERTYITSFSATAFHCIPFKVSRGLSEVATDSTTLQSCRAYDWLKFPAAPARGDFVEGWIVSLHQVKV